MATSQSSATITDLTDYLRQLLYENRVPASMIMGVPGIIVEIDETKMDKRNFNRGHTVEVVWVIAGIERTPEKKVFVVEVQNRNAATIIEIVKSHVHQGSIIYTDCWKA